MIRFQYKLFLLFVDVVLSYHIIVQRLQLFECESAHGMLDFAYQFITAVVIGVAVCPVEIHNILFVVFYIQFITHNVVLMVVIINIDNSKAAILSRNYERFE